MQELAPGTETINFREADVRKTLKDITDGRGPDVGIEAAGFHYVQGILHKVQFTVKSLLLCDKHGYLPTSPPVSPRQMPTVLHPHAVNDSVTTAPRVSILTLCDCSFSCRLRRS